MKWIILIVNLFVGSIAYGQYSFSAHYLLGKMIPHSKFTDSLEANVSGVQIEAHWQLRQELRDNGKMKGRFNPYIGANLLFLDMGLPVTGYQIGAGVVTGAEYSAKDEVVFQWQFSHGFSYLSEKYDTNSFPINYAIGSYMNYMAQMRVGAEFNLYPNYSVTLGANLTHASNGNWHKPNVGLNAYHINAGIVYYPDEIGSTYKKGMYLAKKKYFAYPHAFGLRLGRREHTLEFPLQLTTWIWSYDYRIQKNARHIWDMGVELFSDPNYSYTKTGAETGATESQQIEIGLKFGHQYVFGRLGLRTDLGMYILKPVSSEKTGFYNAIGFDYRLNQNWVLRNRLKAHLNVADYMEWGLMYLW